MINKPYNRIYRPNRKYGSEYYSYLSEISNRNRGIIRAYHMIEKDLIKIFDYIEPSDENLTTFSHKIYELFLRACTEFESNSKEILIENNYVKNKYNILDYAKLNLAMKLSQYEVKIESWRGGPKIIRPFESWNNAEPLDWYKEYNEVKHNRNINFSKANLNNLLSSIAGIKVILFAQFAEMSLLAFQNGGRLEEQDNFLFTENSIFSIKFDGVWQEEDCYGFDWNVLKYENDNTENYTFDQ